MVEESYKGRSCVEMARPVFEDDDRLCRMGLELRPFRKDDGNIKVYQGRAKANESIGGWNMERLSNWNRKR